MKLYMRWWVWVLVVAVVSVIALIVLRPKDTVQYQTEVVGYEDVLQTVDANGEVVPLDKVELSFGLSGILQEMSVRVGDVVEAGNVLGTLSTTELNADVQSAFQAVQSAQGNLDAVRAGSSEESISISQRTVEIAEASVAVSELEVQNKLALIEVIGTYYQAQASVQASALTTASAVVNQTVTNNSALISDAYDQLLSSAWGGVIQARSALAKADEILGVRNGTLNDDYENNLTAGSRAAIESARTAFLTAESAIVQAESEIVLTSYGSSTEIVVPAEAVESALKDVAIVLLNIRVAVALMPATGDLSVSEAQALASSIDSVRALVQTQQAGLQLAFQSVQTTLRTTTHQLESARLALAQAQRSYDASVAQTTYQQILAQQSADSAQRVQEVREAEYAQAGAQLAQAQADPRVVDLVSYEAEVARAQSAYQAARARLENAVLRSPIIGEVTDVVVDVGERVSPGQSIVVVQTTQEQFEVIANVSESDVAKLEVGEKVTLTFDAFGSAQEVSGSVRKIDPAEKLIEGVVYYGVTVSLDRTDQTLALRPGLSADLIFQTDSLEQVLTISQRALQSKDGGYIVRVLKNGSVEERRVEIGLRGDFGRVQIVSGLAQGEEIILRELTP